MSQEGLPLPGVREFAIGDELDRCYTPQTLADAIVAWLTREILSRPPRVVLEPSVGGGAFVRAARKAWPRCTIVGVDLDSQAAGLQAVDTALVCDWLEVTADALRPHLQERGHDDDAVDLVLGNPPFGVALEHWQHGPAQWETMQALLMPWAYPGVKQWQDPLKHARPGWVRPILGRPWPKRVRETGVYVRSADSPTRTELVLPALNW